MGLVKTVKIDKNGRISIMCVREHLGFEPGVDWVEVHLDDGDVKIKKKEVNTK